MLEENKALRMRLHSLTIFRGLLEDPVVSRRPVRRFPPNLRNACNTSFAFCRSFPNLMAPPCAAR